MGRKYNVVLKGKNGTQVVVQGANMRRLKAALYALAGLPDGNRKSQTVPYEGRIQMKRKVWLGAALLVLSAHSARAEMVEDIVQVPVTVKGKWVKVENHPMTVTVFKDNSITEKQPFIVLSHGRSGDQVTNRSYKARYYSVVKYFVAKGYVVFVPTRVGYGVTGGPDVEENSLCTRNAEAELGLNAAAATIKQMVLFAQAQSYVDAERGLLVGQSYGGVSSLNLASQNIPGIKGAVNFSGGAGGDAKMRPRNTCRPDIVEDLIIDWGKTTKIPTLWLYSQNDQTFAEGVPEGWFKGFNKKSPNQQINEFVSMPAYRDDGHTAINGVNLWSADFERFEKRVGIKG